MGTDDQFETPERTAFDILKENIKRQHKLLEQASYELQQKRTESNNLYADEPYYSKKSKYQRKQKYNTTPKKS